jgi:hypothetical protein
MVQFLTILQKFKAKRVSWSKKNASMKQRENEEMPDKQQSSVQPPLALRYSRHERREKP